MKKLVILMLALFIAGCSVQAVKPDVPPKSGDSVASAD